MAVPGLDAVSFARPEAFAALPVAAVVVWLLVGRGRGGSETPDGREGSAGRRSRIALAATRLVVLACLVTAAAGPYTVTTAATPGDPQVTMLVDRSASMGVYPDVADDLAAAIEAEGVGVTRVTVADGNRSRIGDGVVANLRPNGSVLVVSDGQVTGGASLARGTDLARSVNATVNRVALSPNRSDARVSVAGPTKASVGVETEFAVRAAGVDGVPNGRTVTVTVDGSEVASKPIPESGTVAVAHNFTETGPHRVTARLSGDDAHATNDVARKTVHVVDQPRVLYVSRGEYALEGYLRELYDVTRAESVPDDLSPYYAVVVHDVAAPDLGNASALQSHVINGGGLVVVGGEHAFEKGDYDTSPMASLLPVRVGGSTGRESRVVVAVDVSGSARSGMRVQKALALDVLSQLGDHNRVGLVAFNRDAYRIADLASLGENRATLQRKIRSLQGGGGTDIAAGLLGASELLGDRGGTVVLLSDGQAGRGSTLAAAERLADRDVRVVTVGVGNVDADLLRGVADRTGGSFLLADETNRLRVQFGGSDRQYTGDRAVVVDDSHFVSRGVELTASLPVANDVSVKRGGRLLVATGSGAPALSTWRFGLGRVATVTAYGADGGLGDLLSEPDSLVVSRSVNWAVGDPQRKATGVVSAPDTRVGEPTTVVYAGETQPDAGPTFSEVAPGRYEARVVPERPGYRSVLGSAYAVDYRAEYAGLGVSDALDRAVRRTGGRTFAPDQAATIADAVTRQTTHHQRVEREYDWLALVAGLVVLVGEICARRLYRTRTEGVIP